MLKCVIHQCKQMLNFSSFSINWKLRKCSLSTTKKINLQATASEKNQTSQYTPTSYEGVRFLIRFIFLLFTHLHCCLAFFSQSFSALSEFLFLSSSIAITLFFCVFCLCSIPRLYNTSHLVMFPLFYVAAASYTSSLIPTES